MWDGPGIRRSCNLIYRHRSRSEEAGLVLPLVAGLMEHGAWGRLLLFLGWIGVHARNNTIE